MIKRLRFKFVCINMIIVTVMLCFVFGFVLHFTSIGIEKDSFEMMHTAAMTPHQRGVPGSHGPVIQLPHFILQSNSGGEWAISSSGNYDLTDPSIVSELIELTSAQKSGVLKEYDLRFVRVETPNTQRIIFSDISRETDIIHDLVKNCLLIGAVSFIAFLFISILLARWAVKPVAQAWDQQQQFVADASHELKTPLTVILSNAQMLSENVEDPQLQRKLTANILNVSHQMNDLVTTLLNSARVDYGIKTKEFAVFDFSDAVSCSVLSFDSVFFEQGKGLESDIQENIPVCGSRTHLMQLTDILLDNARKYSSEQGRTWITLKRQGTRYCLLTAANEGEPLSDRELKNIFKRFYRTDAARERNGSYGLGLSIAENIVKAHKGKIWAESKEGINTFCVRLPVAAKGKKDGSSAV